MAVGQSATFTVTASGTAPLAYQWQRNGADIAGATAASYTLASPTLADNGAAFRAVVSNAFGSATSNAATLTVTSNQAPTAAITAPANDTLYRGGETISLQRHRHRPGGRRPAGLAPSPGGSTSTTTTTPTRSCRRPAAPPAAPSPSRPPARPRPTSCTGST